jgi:hypothetical protein
MSVTAFFGCDPTPETSSGQSRVVERLNLRLLFQA